MTKSKAVTRKKNTEKQDEIVAYKSFDANFRCRGFQFEVGKTYEHNGDIVICKSGFHACEHPLHILKYYDARTSRFALVRQSGAFARQDGDTKIASAKITIDTELKLPELIAAAIKWVFDRANWKDGPVAKGPNEGVKNDVKNGTATASGDSGAATASGDSGAATASGDSGAATASGNYGAATASGYYGAATASGCYGAATASGYYGAATASGDSGAATASGNSGRARGKKGCALFLVYRNQHTRAIEHAWAGIVGRDGIKADTWYTLDSDGKPKESK